MAQKIKVTIAGHPFDLTASSPEHEEVIRIAADEVNSKISQYREKFPGKVAAELAFLTALNVCINNVVLLRHAKGMKDAEGALVKELERYLEDIDKTSR